MKGSSWKGGFTLLELIIVLVVLGILAASVSYRYFSSSDMSAEVAVDQVVADIQYVQAVATGTLTSKSISFTAGSDLYSVAGYGATGENKSLPGGVTALNTATFTFNSLGEKIGGDGSVNIGGKTITVYGTTGKVVG